MAMREVVVTEEERKAAGGKFFKFNAIGDKLVGRYVSRKEGKFGFEYTFKTDDGEKTHSPGKNLAPKLEKALREGLKPGMLCVAKFTSTLDTGQASPMAVIAFAYDPESLPKPAADEDVPF